MGKAIETMFDGIARRYDLLNHLLSAGRDRAWRKKAVARLDGPQALRVLDLCGGTGDFWKSWAERPGAARGFGVIADFSLPMLREARRKYVTARRRENFPRPALVRMDALHPCFKDGAFDAVLCGYGMRNLDSLEGGLEQVRALLRPGGRFVTLEFFRPATAFTRLFYQGLAPLAIPFLGGWFSSRREAYAYLVRSIRGFCSVSEYLEMSRQRGFREVSSVACDFGISHIVIGVRG
jgi:demethylmenaquinone methyltransferase / 2-methoxy-6-polyprenyl-1,4-benzoquinol methylase